MKQNKLIIGISLIVMLSGIAVAQNVQNSDNIDTVILASTDNYPDALISGAPSKKLGIPVLLTDEQSLSEETETAINNMDPDNIVIIGGPSVISDQLQNTLEENRNTTRLWGTTKIGTSVKTSDYFWTEGSEKATIVQYKQDDKTAHRMLAAVKNKADGESPILISKDGTLSASVLSEINDLGATEVEVYSTNSVNVSADLNDIGVEEVEIEEESADEIADELNNEVETEGKNELVVVAASNWKDSISMPSSANSASIIISSESQIQNAVDAAANASAETEIKVVGNPDLAGIIASRIESDTEKEVSVVSGSPERAAAEEAENDRENWKEAQRQRLEDWKNDVDSSPELREKANRSIQEAESRVNENSSEQSREMLQEAREEFEDGEYFEARKLAIRAGSNAHVNAFGRMSSEEVRDEVRDEQEDLREATQELGELSKEMASELREAETVEERLEIVRETREERREIVNDLREEARERGPERNRGKEKEQEDESEEDENETEEEEPESSIDVGKSTLEMELDENELEVEAKYIGNTGGYTVNKSSSVENGTVNVEFDFKSPTGPATQQIKEYESEVETNLEDGNYTVNADLMVDGETETQLTEAVSAGSEAEFEAEASNQ